MITEVTSSSEDVLADRAARDDHVTASDGGTSTTSLHIHTRYFVSALVLIVVGLVVLIG